MSKQEPYPRSVPYRAPDANYQTPPPPAALAITKGQLYLMGGFCTLFLAAGLGIGLLTMNRGGKREDTSTERNKDAGPPRGRLTERDAPSIAEQDSQKKDLLSAPPLKDPETPKKDPPAADDSGLPLAGGKMTSQPGTPTAIPEAVVEALGGLTASHLYQTYLNIGLLADSVEGEVYEKDEARRLLDTVAGLMTAVEQQLDRVSRQSLKGEEKKAVEQARQITASLRTQTRELLSYWDKGDKDHVARFHQARQDSWQAIKALLNIQE